MTPKVITEEMIESVGPSIDDLRRHISDVSYRGMVSADEVLFCLLETVELLRATYDVACIGGEAQETEK